MKYSSLYLSGDVAWTRMGEVQMAFKRVRSECALTIINDHTRSSGGTGINYGEPRTRSYHFAPLRCIQPFSTSHSAPQVFDDNALTWKVREETYKCYPTARRAHLKTGGNFPYLSRPDEVNVFLQVSFVRNFYPKFFRKGVSRVWRFYWFCLLTCTRWAPFFRHLLPLRSSYSAFLLLPDISLSVRNLLLLMIWKWSPFFVSKSTPVRSWPKTSAEFGLKNPLRQLTRNCPFHCLESIRIDRETRKVQFSTRPFYAVDCAIFEEWFISLW